MHERKGNSDQGHEIEIEHASGGMQFHQNTGFLISGFPCSYIFLVCKKVAPCPIFAQVHYLFSDLEHSHGLCLTERY